MSIEHFDLKQSYLIDKPELQLTSNDYILSDTESIISDIEEQVEEPVEIKAQKSYAKQDEDNKQFEDYFKDILEDLSSELTIEKYTKTDQLKDEDDWGWEDDLSITNTYLLPKFFIKLLELNIKNKNVFTTIVHVLLKKVYTLYGSETAKNLYRLLDYSMDNDASLVGLVKSCIFSLVDNIDGNDNILERVQSYVSVLPLDDSLMNQREMLVGVLDRLSGSCDQEVAFLVKRKIIEWYKEHHRKITEDLLERLSLF